MSAFQDPEIYRDILNGLQVGVSVLDLEKKIVFWSDDSERITGYARIDVLGHSCRDNIFLHCDELSCEMCGEKCSIATALHDAEAVEGLDLIQHKSGHRTPVRTWAIPLRDRHGSIIGIIQTFEAEFAVARPDPNDRSMKERGCLDDVTGLPNQAMSRDVRGTSNSLWRRLRGDPRTRQVPRQVWAGSGQPAAPGDGSNLEKHRLAYGLCGPLE